MIIATYYYSKDIFYRNNPDIINMEGILAVNEYINMIPAIYPFIITIQDKASKTNIDLDQLLEISFQIYDLEKLVAIIPV
jgi:hypothetical protein